MNTDTWEGLSPPYRTIVADPPWFYMQGGPHSITGARRAVRTPPYSMLPLSEIAALPVNEISDTDAHLYLWTTNAWLPHASYCSVGAAPCLTAPASTRRGSPGLAARTP